MDCSKKTWLSCFPALGRRSFLKIGAAASASLMFGCSSRERLTRSESPRTMLLKGEREWAPSVCSLCPSGCAIRAYSEAGRIVAVGGDPEDPNTGGKMCPIGLSMLNLHFSPDRLTSAFRKNPDGKMAPAGTEEVLAFIAGMIRRGGALHIHGRITPFASQLAKALNAACHSDPVAAGMSVYPTFLNTDGRPPILDFENARTAFLFDSNILEHGYPFVGYVRRITEARMRGLRLVTFSPFLTNTATAGDWIPLRSPASASLASLAIAQQASHDSSLRISLPSPEIKNLLESIDGRLLEEASGLSREVIQDLTRRFFNETGPALSDHPDASVLLLNVMKGNLNRPGGLLSPGQRHLRVDADFGDAAQILNDRRNVVLFHQSNPAFSQSSELLSILRSPNRATVVCIDGFMSETAALSDFVLPLASPLETLTIMEPLPLAKSYIAAALPVVRPPSPCRSFDDWLAVLATAVNGSAPRPSAGDFAAETIRGASSVPFAADRAIYPVTSNPGILEALIPSITSSLEMQITAVHKPPSLQPEQCYLTVFEESVQGPGSAPSKWLDEITYAPKIYLHPQRAGRLGIRTGDRVSLNGRNGASAEGVALLFEGVHPDALAIALYHGHTGYGRVARGEPFDDPKDADMARIFWKENGGVNPANLGGGIIEIRKKRG